MTLSEIDRTLREIKVSPVKTLGQNFLHDQNLARWIVDQAELAVGDLVVEIGPGLGALTEVALRAGARVIAIEKDARLARFVRARFAGAAVEVIHGDALDFDLRMLFAHSQVKLIGNLPYYVASQLVIKFTAHPSPISLAVLTLQKEMAQRICARAGSSDYGALSIGLQLRHRVEYLRTVSPSVFVPRPDVESAIVRLTPRRPNELPPVDAQLFAQLVRLGFSQRRKQLRKLLYDRIPGWDAAASAVGFAPAARAEELSLEQWIKLAQLAAKSGSGSMISDQEELFAVVDDDDGVVGSATRREVHANKLLHRAVHIFIFNAAGDLFLQKRSAWKDRHPLAWDSSAAGHVNAGENYDGAAVREVTEELGVAVELTMVAKLGASDATGQEFICLYRGQHDGPFSLPPQEIEAGDFFPPDVINGWIRARPADFAPGFVECWKALRKASDSATPAQRR